MLFIGTGNGKLPPESIAVFIKVLCGIKKNFFSALCRTFEIYNFFLAVTH
jgi:hypothetical protein